LKTVVITGVGSGIGKATCKLFLEKGWIVCGWDINEDNLKSVEKQFVTERLVLECIDVTNYDQVVAGLKRALERCNGSIEVLFNCAGILLTGRFETLHNEEIKRLFEINILGTVNCIQAFLPFMREESGRSHIINMSSASAIYGTPDFSVYSSSKFAIRGLTEALNIELEEYNIQVTDLMPSFVDTPMVRNLKTRPKSIEKLGVNLKAEDIAVAVWNNLNHTKVHHILPVSVRFLSILGRLMPFLNKRILKIISSS
jgi:NAD(P)-dependent dehydrogenase (short-subunit alcohol dehydrogenase family)